MAQSGRAPAWGVGGRRFESDHPDQKNERVVNTFLETVNSPFALAASPKLRDLISSFIYSSVHKSPKTIKTLHETLDPFVAYLYHHGIDNHLAIKRQHVEGFILEISQGRRGKPLSPASVFAFTKDVRAFINYVAGEWSPEEWPNPVRRIKCKRPLLLGWLVVWMPLVTLRMQNARCRRLLRLRQLLGPPPSKVWSSKTSAAPER